MTALKVAINAEISPKSIVGHVEYSIINYNKQLIAVIPGTKTSEDVEDDLKAWKTDISIDGNDYKVHTGFLEQSQMVYDKIKHCDVFVGHSLGAGVAQICALRANRPVITFGSPRVGDKRFAKAMDSIHTRIKSRGDWVTHTPPWFFGYKHGGRYVKIGRNETPWYTFWKMTDHFLSDYMEGLQEYLYPNK